MPSPLAHIHPRNADKMALVFAASGLLFVFSRSILRPLLSSSFLPHSYCYLFNRPLIALHLASDGVIWASDMVISITLMYMVQRARR